MTFIFYFQILFLVKFFILFFNRERKSVELNGQKVEGDLEKLDKLKG